MTKAGKAAETGAALAGKDFVLVYCSAHWCPPCKAFTPELTRWLDAHAARLKVGLVFASCDRDDKAFKEYFASSESTPRGVAARSRPGKRSTAHH